MDVGLGSLFLPLLLSSVAVFFASFVAWMILKHHVPDIQKIDVEDAFFKSVKDLEIKPGTYMFPYVKPEEMKDPDMMARFDAGPWGSLRLMGEKPNFGANLGKVFLFYVVVNLFTAYVATLALPAGAGFSQVFQVCGTVSIMGYTLGEIPHAIFMGRTGRSVAMDMLDGIVYGLITGALFAALWPAAV